ncbi:MAG: type II secretion system protein [Planctomycetota bacterium]
MNPAGPPLHPKPRSDAEPTRARGPLRARRGLTLVEVLIAMLILVIGATMLLIALTAGLNMQQTASDDDETVQLVGNIFGAVDQEASEGKLPPLSWAIPQDFPNNPRYAWRVVTAPITDLQPQPGPDNHQPVEWPFLVQVQIIRKNRGEPIPVTYHSVVLVPALTCPTAK